MHAVKAGIAGALIFSCPRYFQAGGLLGIKQH